MNGLHLLHAARAIYPELVDNVDWGDCWERPLESGVAFEWATLVALASEAARQGWELSFPVLAIPDGNMLFTLRNEVPTHHGAQPGHAALRTNFQELGTRFLQAFVPKLILAKGQQVYSVFREGCPYHKIATELEYDERPDILILRGRPTAGFPRLLSSEGLIEFSFDNTGFEVSGSVRVINSKRIPVQDKAPAGLTMLAVAGIVECSINKSVQVAIGQLSKYERLFSSPALTLPLFLLTGNHLPPMPWPSMSLELTDRDPGLLQRSLQLAAQRILQAFSII